MRWVGVEVRCGGEGWMEEEEDGQVERGKEEKGCCQDTGW